MRVHEPVDRVALCCPADEHGDEHTVPRYEGDPWHYEQPVAWTREGFHDVLEDCRCRCQEEGEGFCSFLRGRSIERTQAHPRLYMYIYIYIHLHLHICVYQLICMYIRRWWLFSARSDTSRKTIRNVKVCAIVHFRAKKNKMWVLLGGTSICLTKPKPKPSSCGAGLGKDGGALLSLVPCDHCSYSDQRIAKPVMVWRLLGLRLC